MKYVFAALPDSVFFRGIFIRNKCMEAFLASVKQLSCKSIYSYLPFTLKFVYLHIVNGTKCCNVTIL